MGKKIVVGLGVLCAVVEGVAPGVVPGDALPIALVLVGLVWGYLGVDANDPTMHCALVVAVGLTGQSEALDLLPAVESYLDAIVDGIAIALYSSIATLMVLRIIARFTEE